MMYLILAILSSMAIAVVMRLSEKHISNNISMLSANYLMCALLSFLFTGGIHGNASTEGLPFALGFGIFNGVLFLVGFLLYQWNIRKNGVTLSALFMKMGVIISVVTAICFFHETPKILQIVGMGIACIAIFVIHSEKGSAKVASGLGLIVLFCVGGLTDATSKIYEELGVASMKNGFLLFTFLSAFLLSLCLCLVKKQKLTKMDALMGFLLGVPNYFSARFLLYSMAEIPAVIAYPTFSVGTIITVMAVSWLLFKERLSKTQKIAMGLILVALVLLNV